MDLHFHFMNRVGRNKNKGESPRSRIIFCGEYFYAQIRAEEVCR